MQKILEFLIFYSPRNYDVITDSQRTQVDLEVSQASETNVSDGNTICRNCIAKSGMDCRGCCWINMVPHLSKFYERRDCRSTNATTAVDGQLRSIGDTITRFLNKNLLNLFDLFEVELEFKKINAPYYKGVISVENFYFF